MKNCFVSLIVFTFATGLAVGLVYPLTGALLILGSNFQFLLFHRIYVV
jgi:hypothetical protein